MKAVFLSLLAAISLAGAMRAEAATCNVSEFSIQQPDPAGQLLSLAILDQVLASYTVTYTTSTQSPAFQATTNFIRVQCDATAFILVGTNPTATATKVRIPSGSVEYFSISAKGLKMAIYDGVS